MIDATDPVNLCENRVQIYLLQEEYLTLIFKGRHIHNIN